MFTMTMAPTLLSRDEAMAEVRAILRGAIDRYRMREGRGLTQAQASKKAGMSPGYIAVLKRAGETSRMSSAALEKLIKGLGMPPMETEQARVYLAAAQVENDGIRARMLLWLEGLPRRALEVAPAPAGDESGRAVNDNPRAVVLCLALRSQGRISASCCAPGACRIEGVRPPEK